ncbi:hypothetical protein DPMN_011202 [Dreissena polymorpha]|uniref:Uncharacterized protein n=1 Tax=Dreissena polymorpha TaxID=45954 RepID=A0A9D4N3L8_DREPO|nr:hypothetical protein DPMN_011202 [Dreissena polymorpha]
MCCGASPGARQPPVNRLLHEGTLSSAHEACQVPPGCPAGLTGACRTRCSGLL